MENRIVIAEHGAPGVIGFQPFELAAPGTDEVTVRHTAIGVNFIDTYHRSGLYPVPLPGVLGLESAGVIEATGSNVSGFRVGDRVCTFGPALGAYATARNVPAATLFKIPEGVPDETVAAALLKGCTAEFLLLRCSKILAGQTVLVHAAAGGVGLLLVQWLKHLGANVIGTVGNQAKADLATAAGADHVLLADDPDIAEHAIAIAGGQGVDVTLDGVGKSSWELSLRATRKRGLIVSYGNASGPVDGIGLSALANHGSLFVTRPTLFDYYASPSDRAEGSSRLFEMLLNGSLSVTVGQRFALADAAKAHAALESRSTSGSTLLIP